jgi:hypothetical protein
MRKILAAAVILYASACQAHEMPCSRVDGAFKRYRCEGIVTEFKANMHRASEAEAAARLDPENAAMHSRWAIMWRECAAVERERYNRLTGGSQ